MFNLFSKKEHVTLGSDLLIVRCIRIVVSPCIKVYCCTERCYWHSAQKCRKSRFVYFTTF